MTEFFAGTTTNGRKREIEELLNNFSQTQDSWKHCLFFMANTQNEYVMMFCLTVLENVINKQWMGYSGTDKMDIRSTLNQYLYAHHNKVPSFIRNKLVKLVVDIGRSDWPHFYPDFFSSILQLVQESETTALGVILLQTTSEELTAPREDLSMVRKEELHRLLLTQVPTVLNLLNNILESVLEKHWHLVAATPPPSPTQGDSGTRQRGSSLMLFSSSPLQSDSLLSNMFKCPAGSNRGVQLEALPPLDNDSAQLCELALSCLAHYFSWVPLSNTITPNLLSTIFHFAAFGCEVRSGYRCSGGGSGGTGGGGAGTGNLSSGVGGGHHGGSNTQSLGVLAMNCINELLSKNCVPQEFEDFLLQMFQQTFFLLQRLTKESTVNTGGNKLTDLDECYVEKFTDFLRLFVSIHLRRFESNVKFPVLEFLALLFKYTFRQPMNEGFFNCLDIWTVFLDYLHTCIESRSSDHTEIINRYKPALLSLVTHILQKLQFRFNQSQLEELDDEALDDDAETEWQHFLRQCLEVIAKVSEILTGETFHLLYEPFQEYMDVYMGLEQYVVSNGSQGRKLTIDAENECRRLHCILRDLSSLQQALGRMADHFSGETFVEKFSDANSLVQRLVHSLAYSASAKLYEVSSIAQTVLQPDFIEVHAQALATLKAYAHWLAQYYTEAQKINQQAKFASLFSTLIEAVVPLFRKQIPEKIVQSAAHLLLSLMLTVRPSYLLQMPCIQGLYTQVSQGQCKELPLEIQLLVYRALSHYLLLPWPNLSETEQDWTNRATYHRDFSCQLTMEYCQLKDTQALIENKTLQQQAKYVIENALKISQDWIEAIASESNKSKQICYQSLQEVVQVTLAIFPVYIHEPDTADQILSFFLAVFKGLRLQMGVAFTERTIQTFMSLFTREQLTETILHESSAGCRVVEKFLRILELIVQEPGSAFKAFLPSIISICMDQIYPIIAQRPSPDIKGMLYKLLFEFFLNNWRYYFKGSLLAAVNNQNNEQMENAAQFVAIMQAFGESFLQPDIALFRQNLESLEMLNTKWKLYHKKVFREMMLFQFLNVLIQVLLQKSHDLLQEEIAISIYNMASVDFDNFYSNFLPHFLSSCEGLAANQRSVLGQNFKLDKDMPSFTQSVHRFVNDLRYYRLINSSLPSGSVKF